MDKFLIAPLDEGLRTDLKAWQIPDQAYARLNNAYIFRGRLKKRVGSSYTSTAANGALGSRLRISLGSTDGSGVFPAAPAVVPGAKFKVGQQFSIGTEIFTVQATGTPVTMLTTGTGTGTFNTTTGAYTFTGCTPSTTVYFYPSEPVMGLTQYEDGTIHNQTAYAFDTQFIYKYSGGSWIRDGSTVLTGNNYNFVWSYNWDGVAAKDTALFITNFNAAEGVGPNGDSMYYYNGSTWTAFKPQFIFNADSNIYAVQTCRLIIPFKNRLLLLNTLESDNTASPNTINYAYTNRCRYSQNGSPVNANAFMEPNQTQWLGGGYIDGPTEEDIIGAELIRDRCIVYFERSTWELAYTGNEAIPFIWQQVNTELGSEAQFSTIPFDKFLLNVGPNGIQACNGINVDRIDEKIPDEVFNIRIKNNGMQRVAGVRDYYSEMAYWTYPTDDNPFALYFPNKVFVFNYQNGCWAINDDCITCFGYWEQQTDITWAEIQGTWGENDQTWTSNVNAAQFRYVIAGNQHGFITKISRDTTNQAANLVVSKLVYDAPTQTVTLTIIDHSLAEDDYIRLEGFQGASMSGIYQLGPVTQNTVVIEDITSDPGTYKGGGYAARVPMLDILSKEWNPYKDKNMGVSINKIDFGVKKTTSGQVTVDYFPSHSDEILGSLVLETSPYTLVPLEQKQRLLWHPIYMNAEGDSVQIRIYYSDTQIKTPTIADAAFSLEGLILYTQPSRNK